MTGRSPHVPATADPWSRVRRRLALHRRPISALLAFVAVLFSLTAVTADPSRPTALPGAASSAAAVPAGDELVVPLQLSDAAVAAMLEPGDVVDVMVADQRGDATLVASELVVTAVPDASDDGPWSGGDGLVMVAADAATALSLAGAASRGVLTVAIRP